MPETATPNIAVVEKSFHTIEKGDFDTVEAVYAPNMTVWHNDGAGEQGREDNIATLRFMSSAIQDLRVDVSRRADVGDGVFQLHVLRGRLPNVKRSPSTPRCI